MDTSNLKSIMMVPNVLAIPLYVSPEEQAMGQMVFHNFLHEEFEHQGINSEDILVEDDLLAQGDHGQFVDENFAQAHNEVFGNLQAIQVSEIGASIRELANAFARSPQRQCIRRHADEVDLAAMSSENFWILLDEVFRNGITGSNLIALFYFCADVLIRCAQQGLRQIGLNLFRWALQYIVERVCKWVHERGGWERACNDAINNKVVRFLAFGILVGTISWLAYRGIRN